MLKSDKISTSFFSYSSKIHIRRFANKTANRKLKGFNRGEHNFNHGDRNCKSVSYIFRPLGRKASSRAHVLTGMVEWWSVVRQSVNFWSVSAIAASIFDGFYLTFAHVYPIQSIQLKLVWRSNPVDENCSSGPPSESSTSETGQSLDCS